MEREFGIVASVTGVDRVLRMGAKVTVCHTTAGSGYERLYVHGLSRSPRRVTKYCSIWRLDTFRAQFIPPGLRASSVPVWLFDGRAAAETFAAELQRMRDHWFNMRNAGPTHMTPGTSEGKK